MWATFIWSTGLGRQQDTGGAAGGAQASDEIVTFLHPVGALASLLLTEEPLDLRHPCCLALLVPAPDTEWDAEPDESQKAEGAPQHDSQEHCLVRPFG